jgi:hypothetical protein
MPLEERALKWLLGGASFVYTEGANDPTVIRQIGRDGSRETYNLCAAFPKAGRVIVLDMEMAKDQAEYLSEVGDPSEDLLL